VIQARLKFLEAKEAALARPRDKIARIPYFCSGCPHNTSTRVPEGSKALAGIGCHYMAIWIRPDETMTFTQMGGEGVPWIGIAPFTETKHVFANLGDGTYFHSGLLAIRAAVAAVWFLATRKGRRRRSGLPSVHWPPDSRESCASDDSAAALRLTALGISRTMRASAPMHRWQPSPHTTVACHRRTHAPLRRRP